MPQWLLARELGSDLNIKIHFTILERLPGILSSFLGRANINCNGLITQKTCNTKVIRDGQSPCSLSYADVCTKINDMMVNKLRDTMPAGS